MMDKFTGIEITRPCVITLNGVRIPTQAVAYEAYGDTALLLMLVDTEDIEFSVEAQDPVRGYRLVIVRREGGGWIIDEDSTYILDTASGGASALALCIDEEMEPLG